MQRRDISIDCNGTPPSDVRYSVQSRVPNYSQSKQYLTTHTVDNGKLSRRHCPAISTPPREPSRASSPQNCLHHEANSWFKTPTAHITDIFSLAPTPTAIFSASGSSTLHIHSTTSPTFPLVQSVSGAHRLGIHHACTSRGGAGRVAVTAGFGGEVKIWTCKETTGDWELWHEIRRGGEGLEDVAEGGSGAAAPASWNGSNGPVAGKTGDAWAIALSADENFLAVTTHDGKIHVWDLVGRQRVQTYETGGGTGGGTFGLTVDLSRDGRLTASGHQNGGVYVFNNDTGRLVYSLSGTLLLFLRRPHQVVII